jgi:hypothetical protein
MVYYFRWNNSNVYTIADYDDNNDARGGSSNDRVRHDFFDNDDNTNGYNKLFFDGDGARGEPGQQQQQPDQQLVLETRSPHTAQQPPTTVIQVGGQDTGPLLTFDQVFDTTKDQEDLFRLSVLQEQQ